MKLKITVSLPLLLIIGYVTVSDARKARYEPLWCKRKGKSKTVLKSFNSDINMCEEISNDGPL